MNAASCSRETLRWSIRSVAWTGILCLVLVTACGGGGESGEQTSKTTEEGGGTATQAAPVVDAASAGTVAGTVVFSGTPPAMQLIDLSSEATCHSEAETDPVSTENVLVNENGTLRNAFVYVKEGLGDMTFPVPTEPVVLDQVGCRYVPHVIGIQAKQPLKIVNSDEGVLHNIHAISKEGNRFNFGMPKPMETVKKFKKPEVMVKIKCDVHGWMRSYAGVLNHPYFAVTGEDGSFNLSPLPPGEYVIEAWHEEYGTQTQTVTIAQQQTSDITFTYQAE